MGLITGDPLEAVPTWKVEQTALPEWYTNYAMDILSNQQAIAERPYSMYGGPRVADFTAPQQQAFDQVGQAATAYQPALQQATQSTQAYNPYAGLRMAAPYLQQSGQTSASQVGQYMNPYTDQVVNRIGELGNRTLQEQILPGIRDKFIGGGTYGGSRNAEMFGRGVRDAMEGISSAQSQALQSGYSGALGAAQTDLSRQAGLGSTIAGLYGSAGAQQMGQAGQLASLGAQAQQLGLQGATALGQVGAQQQGLNQQNLDVAYKDFQQQQAYPQQQQQNLIAALAGVNPAVEKGALTSGTEVPGAYQPSTFAQIAAMFAALKGMS
ncbi:hypothetical protein UFOVP468_4 [uncultured Caudovirales phage]|uniref:Uncharacterized protein n=1 Tax=uncultured Caudovirales phage TaxID=2100421 RepID=A0A6J5MDS9_9CAUD|nr:hypothetical protein UFOVP468_4 [uncultured Caudovirales phage]